MATFEEWRTAKKRLDGTRGKLDVLIVTFQKRTRELETIASIGQPPTSFVPLPEYRSIRPLEVLPTEEQIANVINEYQGAFEAENAAFNGMSQEDRDLIRR
jgi:hypothetical protein